MVKKMSVLLLMFWNMHGALRRSFDSAPSKGSMSPGSSEFALATPPSPMGALRAPESPGFIIRQCFLQPRQHASNFLLHPLLAAIDANSERDIVIYARGAAINGLFLDPIVGYRQTPLIRALVQGKSRSFRALLDAGADRNQSDDCMFTVAMYVFILKNMGHPWAANIMAERNEVLEHRVPVDSEKHNALWHLMSVKVPQHFENAEENPRYKRHLKKIKALVEYGVLVTDEIRQLAIVHYGEQSEIVETLKH